MKIKLVRLSVEREPVAFGSRGGMIYGGTATILVDGKEYADAIVKTFRRENWDHFKAGAEMDGERRESPRFGVEWVLRAPIRESTPAVANGAPAATIDMIRLAFDQANKLLATQAIAPNASNFSDDRLVEIARKLFAAMRELG